MRRGDRKIKERFGESSNPRLLCSQPNFISVGARMRIQRSKDYQGLLHLSTINHCLQRLIYGRDNL